MVCVSEHFNMIVYSIQSLKLPFTCLWKNDQQYTKYPEYDFDGLSWIIYISVSKKDEMMVSWF